MSYLRAVRTHPVVVAAITLVALAAALAFLAVHAPSYQATAQILVAPLPEMDTNFLGIDMLRDSGDPLRTAQTAAQVVDSPEAEALAAKMVGDGYTQQLVHQGISVNPLGESNILAVVATAPGPGLSQRLADDFVQATLEVRDQIVRQQVVARLAVLSHSKLITTDPAQIAALTTVARNGDSTLSFAQRAALPISPSGAPHWVVLLLAMVAGFTVASIVAVLMERFDPIIREPEEFLAVYTLPVLARIPKLSRRQRAVIATNPLNAPVFLREAYRSVQMQLERHYMQVDPDSRSSRTIMVTSASQGDGKTTSAVNLALALVAVGQRVILMDCDLRKPDVASRLQVTEERGLVELLTTETPLEKVLVPAPTLPPLLVLPAGARSGDVMMLETLNRQFGEILREADRLADVVIVDTAPLGEFSDALALIDRVNDVILVGRPGVTDRRNFIRMCDLLDRTTKIVPTGMILVADNSVASAVGYRLYRAKPNAPAIASRG